MRNPEINLSTGLDEFIYNLYICFINNISVKNSYLNRQIKSIYANQKPFYEAYILFICPFIKDNFVMTRLIK